MTTIGKRKNMKRNLGLLVLASVVFTLAASVASKAEDQDQDSRQPIEGTWIFEIHRVNQGITFTALQSFTAGGVTLATGTIDRTPPPPISPLYGSWKRTGRNRYVATILFFVFDPAGNAVAMIKTPEVFQIVGKNNLVGAGTSLACDINGDNCVEVNSPITITGKRVVP